MKKIKYKFIVAGFVALLAELFGPAFGSAAHSGVLPPPTVGAISQVGTASGTASTDQSPR